MQTTEDCIAFIEHEAKPHKSGQDIAQVLEIFRRNRIYGNDMLNMRENDLQHLIPYMGFRIHIRTAIDNIVESDKKEALSQMQRRCLLKPLIPIPKISFFQQEGSCSRGSSGSSIYGCNSAGNCRLICRDRTKNSHSRQSFKLVAIHDEHTICFFKHFT